MIPFVKDSANFWFYFEISNFINMGSCMEGIISFVGSSKGHIKNPSWMDKVIFIPFQTSPKWLWWNDKKLDFEGIGLVEFFIYHKGIQILLYSHYSISVNFRCKYICTSKKNQMLAITKCKRRRRSKVIMMIIVKFH